MTHIALAATAAPAARRGRRSPVPGHFTRAQVGADLGLSRTDIDTFERAGIFGPEQRRSPGDTRAVLYTAVDLGIARFAMSAHRLGIRGEQLRRLTDALRLKRKRLHPGWRGTVAVDPDGDLELTSDELLAGVLAAMRNSPAVVLIRVEVPGAETGVQLTA